MLNLLQELCPLSGVSSREDSVREWIRSYASPFADSIRTDHFGNLMVFKKGLAAPRKPLLLDAHMDEVGVMISGYTEDGCLRFQCVGGLDRRGLVGKRIYLGEQGILGVFGRKPIHLSTPEERKTVPKQKELYIDIGCRKKEEAIELVKLGEVGVFDGECGPFGDGLFWGKALSSRVGCAVLLQLLRENLPVDCTFVFSAQKEVGARGAFGSGFALRPGTVLTVDGTGAWDYPERSEEQKGCILGGGVVLPLYESRTGYDRDSFSLLRRLAAERRIG